MFELGLWLSGENSKCAGSPGPTAVQNWSSNTIAGYRPAQTSFLDSKRTDWWKFLEVHAVVNGWGYPSILCAVLLQSCAPWNQGLAVWHGAQDLRKERRFRLLFQTESIVVYWAVGYMQGLRSRTFQKTKTRSVEVLSAEKDSASFPVKCILNRKKD